MNKVCLMIRKIMNKVIIFRKKDFVVSYYKKNGIKIGSGCLICTPLLLEEPYLLEIGNNVTISSQIKFLTHDYSIHNVIGKSTLYGKITIGNNCFLGNNSILLPGVTLGDNIIVGAGSVVTKSFKEPNIIVAGNPARKIGTWNDFKLKYEQFGICHGGSKKDIKNAVMQNVDKLLIK